MSQQRSNYTTFTSDADYQWMPAQHAATQQLMLLMPFPRKNDATWCRQLNRIQLSIVPMGVASLLPAHGYDFGGSSAFFAVSAQELQPLIPAKLSQSFSRAEIDLLMLTIASAINRLHLDDLLIGTVSPANILLKAIPAPETAVLTALTDAIDLKNPLNGCQYNLRSEYAAPELLEYICDVSGASASCMTTACDVFSLGMLYHELLTGSLPAVRRADSCPVPLEEPQISKALDYPHRQLLRRMLRLSPDKRLQDMSAVIQEINRLLSSGDCYVDIRCPAQAGQTVLLRTGNVNCSRTVFSPQGEATFGPLLADQTYTLFCSKQRLGVVTFPEASSGQHLHFDYDQLSESLLAAPPVTDVPTDEDLAEAPLAEPPVLTAPPAPDVPEASDEEEQPAEPAAPLPAPVQPAEPAAPLPAPVQPAEPAAPVPAPVQPTEPAAAPIHIPVGSDPISQMMALLQQHLDAEQPAAVQPADSPEPAPIAEPAAPLQAEEEEEAPRSHDRTANAVFRNEVIMPNPPLNNIRMIELLPQGYCSLTLINGGSFRIRTIDAARYGIAHLIGSSEPERPDADSAGTAT